MIKHKHNWQLDNCYSTSTNIKDYTGDMAQFVCECGCVKQVKFKRIENG